MRRETKAEKIERKKRESIPLEKAESRRLGVRTSINPQIECTIIDRPIGKQQKELRIRRTKD
jgi:hypothetical protein